MTKETKIGLLVGLAFIILFAIILSEKGAPQRDARSPNFATNIPRTPEGPGPTTPLQDGGRLQVENQLNPIVQPAPVAMNAPLSEEPVVSANTVDEDSLPPLPDDVVRMFSDSSEPNSASLAHEPPTATIDTSVALTSDNVGLPSHSETPGPAAAPRGMFNPPLPAASVATRVGPPVTPTDGLVGEGGLVATRTDETVAPPIDRSATVIPAVVTNDSPTVIRTTHTVKDGDCVSKIAAEYYGRSTPDRIKLIESANKDVLKQKKGIRAGDKLRIPELAGYEDRFEAVAGFTQPRSTPTPTPQNPVRDASIVSDDMSFAANTNSREPDRVEPFEIKDGLPRVPRAVPEAGKPAAGGALVLTAPPAMDGTMVNDSAVARNEKPARLSKTRWYEVQSGDTLSGIARRELGSERKFKTIYQMNRDVLVDKHTLKLGTKLRLPPIEDPALSTSITAGRMSPGTEP